MHFEGLLKIKEDHYERKIAVLEGVLDDQINRGMRTTLVFSGIEGDENNWDETAAKLSHNIHQMDPLLEQTEILNSIERGHHPQK